MKRIKFYLGALAVIAFVSFLSSCKGDSKVTVIVTPDQVTAAPGDVVTFNVILTPDALNGGKLGELTVGVDTAKPVLLKDFSGETNTDSISFQFTVPQSAEIGSTIQITFTATDGKSGQPNTAAALITVASGIPEIVTVNNQTANFVSTTLDNKAGIILGADGVTLTNADNADADLEYAYNGGSYNNAIVSPDCPWLYDVYDANGLTYPYASMDSTAVKKYTGSKTFEDLTAEDINNLASDLTSSTTLSSAEGTGNGVGHLANGDVLIFKTQDGRIGALKVETFDTAKKFATSLTFSVKYQKTPASSGK